MHLDYVGSLAGAHLLAAVLRGNGVEVELVNPNELPPGDIGRVRLLIKVSALLLEAVDADVIRPHIERSVRRLIEDGVVADIQIID